MAYQIITTPNFERAAKQLKKRHSSLVQDLAKLIESLEENPMQGSALNGGLYKIRLAISSKKRGKSGGARVITWVKVVKKHVLLIDIFDKSDRSTLSEKEIDQLLKDLPDELLD
jgi:hypothetical protein